MSFRRKAVTWRKQLNRMADMPHQFTRSQMVSCSPFLPTHLSFSYQEQGKARTSFVSKLLEDVSTPETEEVVKWAALSLYGGESAIFSSRQNPMYSPDSLTPTSKTQPLTRFNIQAEQTRYAIPFPHTPRQRTYLSQTVAAITTFVLAMLTHPHAQHTAQAELDSIIGNDRLPTISDRAQLPYVDALVKEVVRWSPSGPLGT